jgi:hypothetical protein
MATAKRNWGKKKRTYPTYTLPKRKKGEVWYDQQGVRHTSNSGRRKNPPKRINKSTGWLKADAVKMTRKNGKWNVEIRRKPRRKAVTKRKRRK